MSFHEDIKNHFVAIESVDRFNNFKIKTNKNKIVKINIVTLTRAITAVPHKFKSDSVVQFVMTHEICYWKCSNRKRVEK